ncbi:hypothetical protein V1509DRAFT_562656 [Lipomyces kononenkoae]
MLISVVAHSKSVIRLPRLSLVLPRGNFLGVDAPNTPFPGHTPIISIGNYSRRRLFSVTSTTMSDSQKHEYVAILPDKLDSLERRLAVRVDHLQNVKKMFAAGIMVSGGAYLDGPLIEGSTASFKGSVVNIMAESPEQVKEILSQDPYTLNDVWDWEKAQIFNFVCAVRKAKP